MLAAALLALAAPARAEDLERAEALDRQARAAYAGRRYAEAARLFAASDEAAPRAETRVNAARAWEHARDLPRAAAALAAALALPSADAEATRVARERLAQIEAEVGRVRVESPAGGRVSAGAAEGVPIPATLHVAPGEVTVSVQTPEGRTLERRVRVQAGEIANVVLLDPPALPAPLPAPPAPDAQPGGRPSYTPAIVSFAGAGVAAGAAAFLGVQMLDRLDAFEATGRTDQGLHDEAVALRVGTNVAWGLTAVGAGLGLYFVLRPPRASGPASAPASPALSIHPRGVALALPIP